MNSKKVWLITGAGRGMGVDIAKAALAAGHDVVATGRNPEKVRKTLGDHDNLLVAQLDVTSPAEADAAVMATLQRFGHIDVVVNNAGNFYGGFFEELSPDQVRNQLETLLFGPMNVARAVLPVMRRQRSGLLVTISSTAGITGASFAVHMPLASLASKDGWSRLPRKLLPLASAPCWSNQGFSEQISSAQTQPPTPNLPSTTTRPAPRRP